jgi:cell division septation protein DedD
MDIKATPAAQLTLTLSLSEKEAMVLRAIFSSVTGRPQGPRGVANQIDDVLENMGVLCAAINANNVIHLPDSWDDVMPNCEDD